MYKTQIQILIDKGVNQNETYLFHGTARTHPSLIYNDQVGFDMRFSKSGMWGQGIYFAVNASYSKNGYAYRNSDGSVSIFYARVSIGDSIQVPSDSSIRLPPQKSKTANQLFSTSRYDSIKGHTNGSDIYIVYENCRCISRVFDNF